MTLDTRSVPQSPAAQTVRIFSPSDPGPTGAFDERAAMRRALLGLATTGGVIALGMIPGLASGLAQLAVAGAAQYFVARACYRSAWTEAKRGRVGGDALAAVAGAGALAYAAVLLLMGGDPSLVSAAVGIPAFAAAGGWINARARAAAQRPVDALRRLRPASATVVRHDGEDEIDSANLNPGEIIAIRPGARLPADGVVVSGASAVDESALTGDPTPVEVGPGDEVTGGTVNLTGSFRVRATRVGAASVLGQMVRVAERAQVEGARVGGVSGLAAAGLAMLALVISGAVLVWWGVQQHDWQRAITSAIAVLAVASPSVVALAVPTAVLVGTAIGARRGILVKHPRFLSRAARVDGVIFDKTGTLTQGRPVVTDVRPLDPDFGTADVLRLAASVECRSDHPLARAVVHRASADGIACEPAADFRAEAGGGVYGTSEGHALYVGRPRGVSARDAAHADLRDEGKTVIVVEVCEPVERRLGVIAVADTLKPGAGPAVERLQRLGLPVMLLTGDNEVTARALAKQVRIHDVRAEVQPGDREAVVRELQGEGRRLAMVAEAESATGPLTAAYVGLAVGAGGDLAGDSGGIVLVSGDVRLVPAAIRLSRATARRMRGGLAWAILYNAGLIPIAAFGLIHPMLAAAAAAMSSASVLVNGLSLSWVRLDE